MQKLFCSCSSFASSSSVSSRSSSVTALSFETRTPSRADISLFRRIASDTRHGRRVPSPPSCPRAAVLARPLQHQGGRHTPRKRTSTRPTGSRSRAPTSAPRGGRPSPREHVRRPTGSRAHFSSSAHFASTARGWPPSPRSRTSPCPTGSRSRAPTSAPQGGRHTPRQRTSPRSTGSRSRAPTSAPRGGRAPPRSRGNVTSRWPRSCARDVTRLVPRAIDHRAPTLASRGGRPSPPTRVDSFHGQSFDRAHFSTSRWPPPPRSRTSSRPTGSRSRAPTSERLEVAALRRVRARVLVPRAVVFARPLHANEPPSRCASPPCWMAPGDRSRRHAQHVEVAVLRRVRARVLVPRAAVLVSVLQHLEVAANCRVPARVHAPRAVVLVRPLRAIVRWPPSAADTHTTTFFS